MMDEKPKKVKLDKGVETLFRTVLANNMRLSQIADSKANILLSVNAIIISVALSILVPKLGNPGKAHLAVPTYILIFTSVLSIIFAIQSTRPKITVSVFTKKDIEERKVNLLFFGNFAKIGMADFQAEIKNIMHDRDYLYESMIRDWYLMGKVLDHKYKLLSITYHVFMIGMIISVIAFVWPVPS
jgi:hypothetical protein